MIKKLLLCALLIAVAGCSDNIDNDRLRVDIVADKAEPFAIGKLPIATGSAYLRSATAQGLVTFDKEGRIVPALASRWIVTQDGLSFIFRLKKTHWNDGREVSSNDVAKILNVRVKELRSSRFGAELSVVDRAISMTGKIVEIRLKAPSPNLLEILAQPEFGLVRKGFGSGPMKATKYGSAMRLQRRQIDQYGKIKLTEERVNLYSNPAANALSRYKSGDTDMVSGGQFQHLPLLEAADITGRNVQFDPVPGLFGLRFGTNGPFLSERANREAIAMAIDRPKLLSSFGILSWQEVVNIAPEALQNRSEIPRASWTSQRIEDRKIAARNAIAVWKNNHGNIRPLTIQIPTGAGSKILLSRLKSDFAAIGLALERAGKAKKADIKLIDYVADMSTPSWYLNQLSCRNNIICDAEADALVAQAQMAKTPVERQNLLAQAETKLQNLRNYIPIANPVRWTVARDGILGFAPNPRGWHMLQNLGRDPI